MPPIDGFGVPRHRACCARPTTRWRSAPSPSATAPRGAAIAGGGLLGLEAAYALHKLGLQDDRARALRPAAAPPARRARGELLQRYLEGLGLEIVHRAPRPSASTPTAALRAVRPRRDGRRLTAAHPARRARASSPTSSSPATRGLAVNRGVLVDDRMRTERPARSSPRATSPSTAGQRARACGRPRSRRPRSRPTTPSAATRPTRGIVPVTILKVVGIELTSIGRFERPSPATR